MTEMFETLRLVLAFAAGYALCAIIHAKCINLFGNLICAW